MKAAPNALLRQRPGFLKGTWTIGAGSRICKPLLVPYTVEYFHVRVQKEIAKWPVGILADYARIVELLMEFGPDLRMPHSRALGDGLFALRARGREGIGRALDCYVQGRSVINLPAFVKKTRATPASELAIARKRLKGVRDVRASLPPCTA